MSRSVTSLEIPSLAPDESKLSPAGSLGIIRNVMERRDKTMGYNIRKLQGILQKAREVGKKIALCHGCFDGLHDGHIKLFRKAKKANIVVVGVESDEYIKRVKGNNRPFYELRDRIEAIVKTGLVDYTFVIPKGGSRIYKKLYLDIMPDYLVTAVDEVFYKKRKDTMEVGIKLILIKEKGHHSCDKIVRERNA